MFEPLNIFKSLKENYKIMFQDYKKWIWVLNFIALPILFSLYFTIILDEEKFRIIINSSVVFFSIIIGFLINVLILIVEKTSESESQKLNKHEKEVAERKEKLRRNLSYNILTEIFFGVILVLMIVFLPSYSWEIKNFFLSQFIILFLFGYFIISLVNILSKFGIYILTKFTK